MKCNVKCIYCNHSIGSSCHTTVPGSARRLMTVSEGVDRVREEIAKRPNLKIVAISGPGEPLVNPETFHTLDGIREFNSSIDFCMSTNGVLLKESLPMLLELGVKTLTVSMSTVSPRTASRIYEWAIIEGTRSSGYIMGEKIIRNQMEGISEAANKGIWVKVNTILIPGFNDSEISDLATILSQLGVSIHNIVPLVPNANLVNQRAPTQIEINLARKIAARYIKQFLSCRQCRSDVVGIPGDDTIL
ncbi:MAG: radical SAM protein [Candidatus Thorarchaeota archaeon]